MENRGVVVILVLIVGAAILFSGFGKETGNIVRLPASSGADDQQTLYNIIPRQVPCTRCFIWDNIPSNPCEKDGGIAIEDTFNECGKSDPEDHNACYGSCGKDYHCKNGLTISYRGGCRKAASVIPL